MTSWRSLQHGLTTKDLPWTVVYGGLQIGLLRSSSYGELFQHTGPTCSSNFTCMPTCQVA